MDENYKKKELVRRTTVVVAIDLDTGDTNNPDEESEDWTISSNDSP